MSRQRTYPLPRLMRGAPAFASMRQTFRSRPLSRARPALAPAAEQLAGFQHPPDRLLGAVGIKPAIGFLPQSPHRRDLDAQAARNDPGAFAKGGGPIKA